MDDCVHNVQVDYFEIVRRELPMFDGIYISGQLQGLDVQFTVDTGASTTLVSRAVYNELPDVRKPTLKATTRSIKTADGTNLHCDGCGSFDLMIGPVPVSREFMVADIQDDVLLGADILQKDPEGPVDLILSEDRMIFRGQDVPLQQVITMTPTRRKVRATRDHQIPGLSEALVEVTLDSTPTTTTPHFVLAEGHQQLPEKYSLMMAPMLFDVTTGEPPHVVRILNPFDSTTTIRRGTVLGLAEDVQLLPSQDESTEGDVCRATSPVPEDEPDEESMPEHLRKLFHDSGGSLSHVEKQQLRVLLVEFADVFSRNEDDIGRTHLTEHVIDTGDAKPIKCAPRRVPLAYAGEDRKALEQLMRRGCIRPSTSPWGAALVFVRKKDGSLRCCQDSRALNKCTVKDAFPLPRTQDCLDAVAGARIFSTMDITSAYSQIPIREQDIPKTAFVTKYGLYEHVTMPFGLCNAPMTFQRVMELALAGLQWDTCLIYLDDVIIFSRDFDEHVRRLREVLKRLREASLKLKPKKCNLFKSQVRFLGHVINEEGALPDPDNVAKLVNWPVPAKVKDVRAYLGLGNYYRRFVKGYSQLVKPLTELTCKGVAFDWTPACQQAFEKLKSVLLSPEIMAYPSDDGDYLLDCDACDVSIGAVLSIVKDSRERVVAYGSRTLNRAERNYCVTDRECLAVKYFCEHYKHYLLGREFAVRTDHQALKWLFSMKEPKGRIARWIEALSPFNFSISYRPGKQHLNADAMSRCPEPQDCHCTEDTPLRCGPCKKCQARSEDMSGKLPDASARVVRQVPTRVVKPAEGGQLSGLMILLSYFLMFLYQLALRLPIMKS